MCRYRKDASPDDIGTYSYEGGYWYGTRSILANGAATEIPHLQGRLQEQLAAPGTLAQGPLRRILALL